ncbi:hypothetical protein FSP39_002526 [Pinctada imbricata]|uniref:Uncharacterized protein n=1 Tax=Pinctada imbricata TaxID=66713 RepID=A0AA88YU76_PINIB|nr:hypothetical protein FSP39_002526 [Pinctada imbricata]
MEKYTKIERRILMCLECGHWYEAGTLCGNCYQKVKRETAEQMAKMGDDLTYNSPLSEVVVRYEGEEVRETESGKYVVEMKKEKPQWFSDKLMKKAS